MTTVVLDKPKGMGFDVNLKEICRLGVL